MASLFTRYLYKFGIFNFSFFLEYKTGVELGAEACVKINCGRVEMNNKVFNSYPSSILSQRNGKYVS
jgi:hypothetical protein